MDKYYVYGRCPLGGGTLCVKEGKRFWGKKRQEFTKEELDNILPKIGPEWNLRVYNIKTNEIVYASENKAVYCPDW